MDLMKSMIIAASGLKTQGGRMRVIAENMANAGSTAKTPDAEPYRRKIPTFTTELDRATGVERVKVGKIERGTSAFGERYEPWHPAANEQGYVKTSNVNSLIESIDMGQAQRGYEANLNVINTSRRMLNATIELLRR
ncbi:MAG: flagellar basal body rod protein FlgC [Candidatus Phaeomarinobacter sp.]